MTLGDAFRLIRQHAGLTQRDFAARLGLTVNFLSLLECGNRGASFALLTRVREEFGYDPYLLMHADTDMDRYRELAKEMPCCCKSNRSNKKKKRPATNVSPRTTDDCERRRCR